MVWLKKQFLFQLSTIHIPVCNYSALRWSASYLLKRAAIAMDLH
jgi:hypothetical protein